MSGLSGVYRLDGRPARNREVEEMLALASHRGPDGLTCWYAGPVALGYAALRTTPEAMLERQPLVDDEAGLCLTFDGRLDNRAHLRAMLGGAGTNHRPNTDGELVLQAYRRWGTKCPEWLFGDFAFALWDGRARHVFCARDFLGHRPFYYHLDGRSFRWSSEPQQVLAGTEVSNHPNEGFIGECLAGTPSSTTETLYASLQRLAPAHGIVVSDRGLRTIRYWDWEPGPEIRHRDPRDYGNHLRSILEAVTRDHLRSAGTVGLFLSGGLDSSALLGIATDLARKNGGPPEVETYSMVFPGLACDESDYLEDVLSYCRPATVHTVRPEPLGFSHFDHQIHRYRYLPEYPNAALATSLQALAVNRGCKVMLTGEGGDIWLTGSRFYYRDLLRGLRLPTVARMLSDEYRRSGRKPHAVLWPWGLLPLVPDGVRRRGARVLGRSGCPPWIDASFCRRVGLADRIRTPVPGGRGTVAALDTFQAGQGALQVHHRELAERSASWFGYELRDPLSDRRVVEFALAIPEDQRQRPGETRHVLREAVLNFVPETVRRRPTKAEFSHAFGAILAAPGGEDLFRGMALEDRGWVDGEKLREMHRNLVARHEAGAGRLPWIWELWMALAVERWLKIGVPGVVSWP